MVRQFAAIAVCALLAACVDRPANTVQAEQSFDGAMTCRQIAAEYAANNQMLERLARDSRNRDDQNALAVGGVLLAGPLMLTAIDSGEAERAEVTSYETRNGRLLSLAEGKGCPPLPPPFVPEQATQTQ